MDAYNYLGSQKVNIEVILWVNDKGILHYGIRLRPWKQDTKLPSMILVQGLSIDDAFRNAAREHYHQKWVVLNYAARPWQLTTQPQAERLNPAELAFLAPETGQDESFTPPTHIDNLKRHKNA